MNRRTFLQQTGALTGTALAGTKLFASPAAVNIPKGKAEHVIFLWLGGGMAQIDTFDPKRRGNSKASPKLAGSEYGTVDTIVPGVAFCEHLHRTAKLADRLTAVRTINHHLVDEHAFGTNFVHTGRLISGSITYPSIGSIIGHLRGAANPEVPAYMVIGYPNVSRGPGFLGAKGGYVYLVDTESGPAGFTHPEDVPLERAQRRQQLLQPLADRIPKGSVVEQYRVAQAEAMRLAGPDFMRHFRLSDESAELRNAYGGEFGQRCLLARRLVQSGVRFIEVSHNLNFINGTGWDTHNEGQQNQHVLIQELDIALSALITDLENQKLLDKTLVAIGTEFGRPASYDGRGGRGHQGSCFSLLLAGGGLNHQGAYGVTDDLSKNIIENPVSVPDFHATIHAALGLNPADELFDGSRPVPITDQGKPIESLFV
ncbi:DUF1501 domain-containing protein [Blastopirellula marina]|uniref:DUF1501 domain-containing protein n=1 Tax=Blastopirellula marina TaxID=124 RepID=A0A2S8F0D8_9BACT|nr:MULTISPECIES: DUF1501 domain-containing protein [Pirellulaceae]PQO25607.1 DUF1501 domain-containing protein [Blastopirellula marina]RCS43290.1 DUF1501 domain-containing protein [Bremerella cremea]